MALTQVKGEEKQGAGPLQKHLIRSLAVELVPREPAAVPRIGNTKRQSACMPFPPVQTALAKTSASQSTNTLTRGDSWRFWG
nr:hypothetical protein FFPRI1PSEUD_05000 [Pseudomonas sp. FFPRI_1]